MSITLFFDISGAPAVFDLPSTFSWSVNNPRLRASRMALAGNEIQQYASKSEDAGTATYSQEIPAATYEAIIAAHLSKATCYISDGLKCFEAVIDIPTISPQHGGKAVLSAAFYIVQRVA